MVLQKAGYVSQRDLQHVAIIHCQRHFRQAGPAGHVASEVSVQH